MTTSLAPRRIKAAFAASVLALCATPGYGQGIPVIDVTAILHALEQVRAWEGQYQQMENSLNQQMQQLQNSTGSRGLGTAVNALPTRILPTNLVQQLGAVKTHGDLSTISAENFGRLSSAMQTRSTTIQELMRQINSTNDPKSIQELTARIQAEQVMVSSDAQEAAYLKSQIELRAKQIDQAHTEWLIRTRNAK